MAKFGKKPTDDQMLEGGGAGSAINPRNGGLGGRKTNAALAAAAAPMLAVPAMPAYMAAKKDAEEKEKREAKKDSMTTGEKEALQEVQDEKMRQKMKTAPTTKTEMGKPFAGGGMTASSRADGIAQRGKTRGMVC
jgi:hypothetical protein